VTSASFSVDRNEKKPTRILNQPKSSSVIAFYWGVKGLHPELDIHNMLFSRNEYEEYNRVFEGGNISNDPSVYLCITSKHVKSDAPQGSENWFALVTAPNDQNQDWNEIITRIRKNVISKVNRMLSVDIEPLIEFEDVLAPPLIRQRYASAFGAIFGNSSNNKFAAFLRHPNFSRSIKGLYFAGGTCIQVQAYRCVVTQQKLSTRYFDDPTIGVSFVLFYHPT
jgi:phytoene dehydrogenase-like protein